MLPGVCEFDVFLIEMHYDTFPYMHYNLKVKRLFEYLEKMML